MTHKTSVSLTDAQAEYARSLVDAGRFSSVSAVLQQGLELLRDQNRTSEALAELLRQRRSGAFVPDAEGAAQTRVMLDRKRRDLGL